jgi:hypothetical protein
MCVGRVDFMIVSNFFEWNVEESSIGLLANRRDGNWSKTVWRGKISERSGMLGKLKGRYIF